MSVPTNVTDLFYKLGGDVKTGYGAQFKVGIGNSPETFIDVAAVFTIKPGSRDTAVFDKTHLRSPNRVKEKGAGMIDPAAFSIQMRWLPGHASQAYDAGNGSSTAPGLGYLSENNQDPWNFEIELNDGSPGTTIDLSGFVTKYEVGEIGPDNPVDLTIEITPDGDWTVDPAS